MIKYFLNLKETNNKLPPIKLRLQMSDEAYKDVCRLIKDYDYKAVDLTLENENE